VDDAAHGFTFGNVKTPGSKARKCFAPGVVVRTAEGGSSLCAPVRPVTLSIEPTQEIALRGDLSMGPPRGSAFARDPVEHSGIGFSGNVAENLGGARRSLQSANLGGGIGHEAVDHHLD
jgi:hypothetical protein